MKKRGCVVLIFVCILALMAGCASKKTEQKEATVQDKDKDYVVQLGYYNCDHMTAACIAKDAGIFKQLGLNVNVTGNGHVPEAMAAGKMDVGYIGTEGLMRAYLKGSPIFVAANNHLGGSYYLVAANEIKDADGLIGKKVALGSDPEKNNSSWIRIANDAGIPAAGSKYEVYDMELKDRFLSLKSGKIAGYLTCDPWGSMAEYDKCGHIVQALGKLPDGDWGSCCVFSMNKNFAENHPELAQKMILAHAKALEYIYTNPVSAAKIFAANYFVPEEVAMMTVYKKTVGEGRTLTWKVDPKNFADEINYDLGVKTLDKAPKVEEFIQTKLLDECGVDDFDQFIKEKVDPVFPLGMTYEQWKQKAVDLAGKAA
ncbi:MAG TPA: periplasmic-binding protein-like II family lipoprotein [Desulfotomaculum sp.]|nr:MAG: ABC-type nitrate/sulfonate/bicarbonate transport system, periplasmic component [Desulfotomaculum sp. 46_296]HAG11205.1 periplasmic-binding protein-like II family lipoprotein [Desulfotomaculum sp.]HBY03167.1 periplasmic-binding protein-like II family lipoprotein [Desulfotomaculum sp.]